MKNTKRKFNYYFFFIFFFANCETTAAEKFLATAGGEPPHYALRLRYLCKPCSFCSRFCRFSLRYDHVITENFRLCLSAAVAATPVCYWCALIQNSNFNIQKREKRLKCIDVASIFFSFRYVNVLRKHNFF